MTEPGTWHGVQALAGDVAAAGFAGIVFTEMRQPPWLSVVAAHQAAPSLDLATGIAVAFPRSPMITAQTAWELAEATDGRFRLGLGSQVRGSIERRYGERLRPARRSAARLRAGGQGVLVGLPRRGAAGLRGPALPAHPPAAGRPAAAARPRGPAASTSLPSGRRWCAPPARSPTGSTSIRCTPSPTSSDDCGRRWSRARPRPVAASTTSPCSSPCSPHPVTRRRSVPRSSSAAEHSWPSTARRATTPSSSTIWASTARRRSWPSGSRPATSAGGAALITDDMLDQFAVVCRWDELADRLLDRYGTIAARLIMYTAADDIRRDPRASGRWSEVAAAMRSNHE